MGFLTETVERVRRELDAHPLPDGALLAHARALPAAGGFRAAVAAPGVAVIAEVKRASPSAGAIADADPGERAARYERGGAAAVSVLTEARHFGGSLADLRLARRGTGLPILRKDFIVHPSQVLEARANGADAVLLITAALEDPELVALQETAADLGMGCLVEAHSHRDVERAVASGAQVIGVNARDLETLEVDPARALTLLGVVPEDRVRVLESGIATREDVRRAEDAGAGAVLVGEALMRAADPEAKLRELLGATEKEPIE